MFLAEKGIYINHWKSCLPSFEKDPILEYPKKIFGVYTPFMQKKIVSGILDLVQLLGTTMRGFGEVQGRG